jgi:hypothetical protein
MDQMIVIVLALGTLCWGTPVPSTVLHRRVRP